MTDQQHTPTPAGATYSVGLPKDFIALLPPKTAADKRPHHYLWVFDPADEEHPVTIENAKGDHPANYPTHQSMADHVTHPERVDGYATAIKDGWRIYDADLGEVDPYVRKQVLKALAGEHPAPSLPSIRYHGDPSPHSA